MGQTKKIKKQMSHSNFKRYKKIQLIFMEIQGLEIKDVHRDLRREEEEEEQMVIFCFKSYKCLRFNQPTL